ncbi:hypothetical protein [Coprobacillus sp. AF33-1AC]|nr:hypothetical protein [Coprobacillus sp. AF33-1AC]
MLKCLVRKYFSFIKGVAFVSASSMSYLGFYEHECPKQLEHLKK